MKSPAALRDYALFIALLTVAVLLTLFMPDAAGLRRRALSGTAPLLALPRQTLAWLGSDAAGRAAARLTASELRTENEHLRQRVAELELQTRTAAPQQLPTTAATFALLPAMVIGADVQPWPMELLLNCGQHGGAVPLQGVATVSDGRLVCLGRVSTVTATAARFQPLVHPACKLPAQLANGRRGLILAGTGTMTCRLDYASPELHLQPGDEIFTAGDGGYLPAGLLLGTVGSVTAGSGPFQEITVTPALDPYRCDAVFLLPAPELSPAPVP